MKSSNKSITELYKGLKPLILRDLARSAVGASAGSGSGGSAGVHDHPEFITEAESDLKYTLISTYNSHAGNSDAHHSRQHAITSGDDHSFTAAQGQILGATATDTLGLYDSASDGRSGGIILKTSVAGAITVNGLQATVAEASNYVLTPEIQGSAGLLITALDNLILSPDVDLELTPEGNIYFDSLLASVQTTEGDPNIWIDPATGLVDALTIQANEAYFDAVIAEARWAEAGAIELTRSVAPLTRPFTIPDVNSSGTMYVGYLGGLPGYNPLGEGHIVKIPFFQDGGFSQQPCSWAGKSSIQGDGVVGGAGVTTYYSTDFSEFDPSGLGIKLMHTGASNSLVEVTNTAAVYDDAGNKVLRIQTNLSNCHTHYDGSGNGSLSDYEFTGRFKILSSDVGFGLTLYSDYPNSDSYYRVRFYSGSKAFHVSNHGSGWSMSGTTQSTYEPADNLNVWHRFKIQIGAGASGTELKAKFWLESGSEPGTWDIDCVDTASFRTAGTFGLWYMAAGPNNIYVDDLLVESLGSVVGGNTVATIQAPTGVADGDFLILTATYPSSSILTVPSGGWTVRHTRSTTNSVTTKVYTRVWSDGDPLSWAWELDSTDELLITLAGVRNVRSSVPIFSSVGTTTNFGAIVIGESTAKDNGLNVVIICRHDGGSISFPYVPAGYVDTGVEASSSYGSAHYYRALTEDSASYSPSFPDVDAGSYFTAYSICLHPEDGQDAPFFVGSAWGTVAVADPQPVDTTAEEVAYTFTTLGSYKSEDGSSANAVGKVAQIDARVQDYGDPSGDVYMLLTVLDKKGPPYIRLARHSGFNQVTGFLNSELIAQFGQLAGLGISGVSTTDEPGIIVFKENGQKVLLSPNQFILEGADSYWYDLEDQLFLRLESETGISLVAGDEAKRRVGWIDSAGTRRADIGLTAEGWRFWGADDAVVIRSQQSGGVDAFLKLSSSITELAGNTQIRLYSASSLDVYTSDANIYASTYMGGTRSVVGSSGGLIVAPAYDSDAFYASHSLIQSHKTAGGFGAWTIENLFAEISFIPSSQPTSVDRKLYGKAVAYNRVDGTVVEWDFSVNKSATATRVVGDSNLTIGVSSTGRAYIKVSGGTSAMDVTWNASWL